PIWISFNAKDQYIEGLPNPDKFTAKVLMAMDTIIMDELAGQLVTPADVLGRNWPKLRTARGKFLLILDEGGDKRDHYLDNWRARPMFALAPEDHPASAVMVINDPLGHGSEISRLVKAGYLVRTRADADTVEARSNDTRRREAAFSSGAHAISTDYYLPAHHFGNDYQVHFPEVVRCNPKTTSSNCGVEE
ncbi:MAG: hypothetical protein GXP16_06560, partial [Gammaproteobacteria bacterium]|nr:hypothetical protein [Gammaproteobacteria bacterium]